MDHRTPGLQLYTLPYNHKQVHFYIPPLKSKMEKLLLAIIGVATLTTCLKAAEVVVKTTGGMSSTNIFLDESCSTVLQWAEEPFGADFPAKQACVVYVGVSTYSFMNGSEVSHVAVEQSIATYAVTQIINYRLKNIPFEVKVNTVYEGALSNALVSTGFDFSTVEVCGAKSIRTSGKGLTRYDCCLNKTLETCIYFATMDTQFLPQSTTRCVASYVGYGSVANTPCAEYYQYESAYYTPVMPAGSNVFTDFGQTPVTYTFDCYVENWSNYRTWTYAYDYKEKLAECDIVFYAFYTYEDTDFREPHDKTNIEQMVADGHKVVWTIGGWNFDPIKANEFWLDKFQQSLAKIVRIVTDYKMYGIDIDIEWPGQRGLSTTSKTQMIQNFATACTTLQAAGFKCMIGVQPVGTPYDPDYYNAMHMVDQVNVFGYDMAGCFDLNHIGDQSQMLPTEQNQWSLKTAMDNIIQHFPVEKVAMGVPIYTRGYLIKDNKAVGCFPPANLAGLREDGVDVLRERSPGGQILPMYCLTDSLSSIQPSATNPVGKECVGVVGINGTIYHYNIPFGDTDTMEELSTYMYDNYGMTRYFSYAHSMDPHVGTRLKNSLIKRNTRAYVSTPAYSYPTTRMTGVVECPGIVYYSSTLVVTNRVYKGCIRPDGLFCYYRLTEFQCIPDTAVSAPPIVTERCLGTDTQLLVPATANSKRIMCNDLKLYIDQVSICSDKIPTIQPGMSTVIPISINSDFPLRYKEIYSAPEFSYTSIRIPKLCDTFEKPYSCMEYVCRGDATCMFEFRRSPYFSVCAPITEALNEYDNLINLVVEAHKQLESIKDKIMKDATRYHLATLDPDTMNAYRKMTRTDREEFLKRDKNPRFFGFIVAGLVGFVGAMLLGGGGKDYSGQINALDQNIKETNNRVDVTNKNVEMLHGAVVNLQADLQAFAEDTKHGFAAVGDKFNELIQDGNEFKEKVNHKFDRLDNIVLQLATAIQDVTRKLELASSLAASVISYTNHIAALTARLRNYALKLSNVADALLQCHTSISQGKVDGCTDEHGELNLITVETLVMDATKDVYLVMAYIKRVSVEKQAYRGSKSYCSGDIQYIAASECIFVQYEDKVYHKTLDLDVCEEPVVSFPFKCGPYSVTIEQIVPPVGHITPVVQANVTVPENTIQEIIDNIKNNTGPIITTIISEVDFSNLTQKSYNEIVNRIIPNLTDYKPTWAVIPRAVRAGVDLAVVIVLIVTLFILIIFMGVVGSKIRKMEMEMQRQRKSV